MKAMIAFSLLATLTAASAFASPTVKPKTLSCTANNSMTDSGSTETVKFSVVLQTEDTQIPAAPHDKIYSYRNNEAFKSKDGRYTIGLQAQQPFQAKGWDHDIITIWAADSVAGVTSQAGGGAVNAYKTNIDHQYMILSPNVDKDGNLPSGEMLEVQCDLK